MKKTMILCLLLLGIGLAGLQAQQRIKVKRLPIDTYEAVGEDEEDFEEPTGADFGTARTGETTDTDEPSSADAEDKEGEDSGEKANPKCPNPDGNGNSRMASSEPCDDCDLTTHYIDGCGKCRLLGEEAPDKDGDGEPDECDECPDFDGPMNCAGKCEAEPVCGCDENGNENPNPNNNTQGDPNSNGAIDRLPDDIKKDLSNGVSERSGPGVSATNIWCGHTVLQAGLNSPTQSGQMAYESAHQALQSDNLEAFKAFILDPSDENKKAMKKQFAKSEAAANTRLKEYLKKLKEEDPCAEDAIPNNMKPLPAFNNMTEEEIEKYLTDGNNAQFNNYVQGFVRNATGLGEDSYSNFITKSNWNQFLRGRKNKSKGCK